MSRDSKQDLMQEGVRAMRANEAAVDHFDRLAAEKLGVNRTDARCLDILDNEGGALTAGQLAERTGLTTAAITTALDRLEAKGYVRRVRDEQDRRRVLAELTPLLRERSATIWGPLGEEGMRAMERFTREELEVLRRFFESGRAIVERHIERIRDLRFD